ncbi:MAG: class II glutamine amidotransferase [Terracoccus sp.]
MCRLFGMSAGSQRVRATFWLLDAPDSLRRQSHANPDGTGLGTFDEQGRPLVEKQALAAWDDDAFAMEARQRCSATFVAHVRHSSGSGVTAANTHPFEQDGRLFARNGVVGGLHRLEEHLGPDLRLVSGDTDSERVFALITRETERAGGDVSQGISVALGWVDENLPIYAVNLVLTTATDLWALRHPDTHELWVLERAGGSGTLDHRSRQGTHVVSRELADAPSVVVASERLDDGDGWRLLEPGVLVHVGPDLVVTEREILPAPPRHQLTLADLGAAAPSQKPTSR